MPTLMVSVSGIRGIVGDGIDPEVIVKYASAYAEFCGSGEIVIGTDGRISGTMVKNVLSGTLTAKGFDVIDLGVCPTPTVLYNVKKRKAAGGISISASHNPNEWNALKLLNNEGEFLTAEQNKEMLSHLEKTNTFKTWDKLGSYKNYKEGLQLHLNAVLKMPHIDVNAIREKRFKVLLDCVNGAGSYIMPQLLARLGCEVVKINCEKTGVFPRLPEPIPANLVDTMEAVKENDVDVGIVVDPDVDRMVIITDTGDFFSEENTIVQAVKFVLSKNPGNVVVNLSTTRTVDDVAKEFDCEVFRSPVGEANVVKKMKEVDAVIGGEGSGGVIYPGLHYGRDALVGTVILLQLLTDLDITVSELKDSLPEYFICKDKINITGKDPDAIIEKLIEKYSDEKVNTDDGLRIDFEDHWVHLRKSNTEPIMRCIVESKSESGSADLVKKYMKEIEKLV